jgi:monoterpene epsilon-lactone hydrolase
LAIVLLNLVLRIGVKWRLGLHIDIPLLRGRLGKLNDLAPPSQEGIRREPVDCAGVPAEWLIPADCHAGRVLFYIHGGAFVARTPKVHAAMVSAWCWALNARALMVDYRLAPEHPYPAAFNDCSKAYLWLLEQGTDPNDIVVAGDSAGGNLAMATLQRAKTEGKPLPACAVLLSPFLDFSLSGGSALSNARHDPVFNLPFAIVIRQFYAQPAEYLNPGVSPLFGDFTGLPPLLFQVGSREMLLDDAMRAAALAHRAAVETHVEIWHRLPHVFQIITQMPQARAARESALRFISNHTGWDIRLSEHI